MTLNFQTYLKKMLKRFYLASIPINWLEYDQIPVKFLRDGAEVSSLPLRNITNLSIKLTTLGEECKIAKLNPIFKKGARTDPRNYRPISLSPLVSKIIEKSIYFQIEGYVNKKKLIYMY